MIVGIGVDLLKIARVSTRLAKRILSDEEFILWTQRGKKLEFLAGRFSLKEAFFKALGSGVNGHSFKDISFLNDEKGKPYVAETLKILEIKREYGFENVHVTLSHDAEFVIAFVVLEK